MDSATKVPDGLPHRPRNAMIFVVAGARPNFMKIAPIARALNASVGIDFKIVHTGQHYDREMSDVFFEELGIATPDFHLECGGGSHAVQTGKIMVAFEELCAKHPPDMVLVVGDVNSTLACAVVAKKHNIPVAHVEAGLRSGDMAMPEEINRLVTDSISDLFFVTEPSGVENLHREGKAPEVVHYVGHVMVDNVLYQREKLRSTSTADFVSTKLKNQSPRYGVVTLHRPSNVDEPVSFGRIASALRTIGEQLPLVFPMHPRTKANLERFGLDLGPNVAMIKPLGYMDFLNLWKDAAIVLTDSGGLQEETTALGVPCVTIRENTERPITITEGTNVLAGTDPVRIASLASAILRGNGKQGRRPHLWDGRAAERIAEILCKALKCRDSARLSTRPESAD